MLLDTLKELCALSGPSGFEDPVRNYLERRAKAAGAETRVDALGNLICEKKGAISAPHKLLLDAHMDEVGLMVRHITEEGYLKFVTIGGIDRRVLLGKPVFVGDARIPGVIGLKAIHLTTEEERKATPPLKELCIDIGAGSREEAEKLAQIGDYAVFSDFMAEFGHGMLKAKAIDDRIGCAILVEILERDLPIDVTFVFAVQEEVGLRGAYGAAFSITPEIALAIEGTSSADIPTAADSRRVCIPGKGPVISYMDRQSVFDEGIFRLLTELAKENDIPWQTKNVIAGGNDAGAYQRTKTGARVGCIATAVRYLHSPSSVAAISDFEHIEALTWAFIQAIAQGRN